MSKIKVDFYPDQPQPEPMHHDDTLLEERIVAARSRERWLQEVKYRLGEQTSDPNRVFDIPLDPLKCKQIEAERAHFTNQLRTAADISRHLTTIPDPDQLLTETVNLLQARFDLYYVQIYLLDETTQNLVLQAASGETGKNRPDQRHQIWLNHPDHIVARAARDREMVVVEDVNRELNFLPHPLLPNTRCEMAAPLIASGKLLGVLEVQVNRTHRFIPLDLDIFYTLAGQIAIALENSHLFAASQQATQRLQELDRQKSEFLSNMGHELRTPLNSITGYAALILRDMEADMDSQTRQDLQAIYDNSQQLMHLVNDILNLASEGFQNGSEDYFVYRRQFS